MNSRTYVGSDPEFFLFKAGQPIASQGIIEGDKYNPHNLKNGGVCHRDNVMGEIGPTQSLTASGFVANINSAISDVREMINDESIEMKWIPFVDMPEDQLQHYEAMVLGCEPDMDCWELDKTPPPNPYKIGGKRSAGGHVHLGFDFDRTFDQVCVAKMCDIYLGAGSVLFDDDQRRRELYGRAGHYRRKPYGIEYRTLSNVWVSDERLMRWVFRAAQKAVANKDMAACMGKEDGTYIQHVINDGDMLAAKALIQEYNGELPPCQLKNMN